MTAGPACPRNFGLARSSGRWAQGPHFIRSSGPCGGPGQRLQMPAGAAADQEQEDVGTSIMDEEDPPWKGQLHGPFFHSSPVLETRSLIWALGKRHRCE